jgi:hypothetical protein
VRSYLILGSAIAAIGLARTARTAAQEERGKDIPDAPSAPSAAAAPFVSLGYRELAADLLWVRLTGYFGGDHSTADAVASLTEAIAALDPQFERPIEWGARATTIARYGVDQRSSLRAIEILDAGAKRFPNNYRIPLLEGQIYTQDLQTKDPAQRRAWDEKGVLLVETAIRKPGAPPDAAEWAAVMRTRLGQHEHAVDGLREMLLVTADPKARDRLIAKLAEMDHADATQLRAELDAAFTRFTEAWKRDRHGLPATMYVLVGPRPAPGIDMTALATGGRDLVVPDDEPPLPPVPD